MHETFTSIFSPFMEEERGTFNSDLKTLKKYNVKKLNANKK
jgi:hypothetical protein